jgi:macrolide-specific efflux system membrane fusion protein
MKRKWLFLTGIGFLLILGFFLIRSCNRSTTEQSTGEETARVVRRDMGSTVMATGIIKPMVGAEVKVGSRISGVVKQLSANIGDKVLKGQLLAELDDAELRAKLHQAEASLAKARTDSEYADLNVKRQRSLFAQNFISRQQVDLAENANEVASAQLKLAEANLDYARVQLNYSRIFSPTEGVIASVSTQEGETVSASLASPTFVSIIDLERLEVQTFVDETDIGKIRLGQEARFTVDTYSDTDFAGVVTAIYPKAVIQDNVVNYIVTLAISDSLGKTLRPEMTTNVSIFLEMRRQVLAVPTQAITREGGERFVTVIDGDKKIPRRVEIGWKDKGMSEILSGLKENEIILIPDTNKEDNL